MITMDIWGKFSCYKNNMNANGNSKKICHDSTCFASITNKQISQNIDCYDFVQFLENKPHKINDPF